MKKILCFLMGVALSVTIANAQNNGCVTITPAQLSHPTAGTTQTITFNFANFNGIANSATAKYAIHYDFLLDGEPMPMDSMTKYLDLPNCTFTFNQGSRRYGSYIVEPSDFFPRRPIEVGGNFASYNINYFTGAYLRLSGSNISVTPQMKIKWQMDLPEGRTFDIDVQVYTMEGGSDVPYWSYARKIIGGNGASVGESIWNDEIKETIYLDDKTIAICNDALPYTIGDQTFTENDTWVAQQNPDYPSGSTICRKEVNYYSTSTDGCNQQLDSVQGVVVYRLPELNFARTNQNDNTSICGGTAGYVYVYFNGGMPPYTLQAYQNQEPVGEELTSEQASNSFKFSGLGIGSYDLVITDANQCSKTIVGVTITETLTTSEFSYEATMSDITCHDANDGAISITVSGTYAAPLTYAWTGTSATTEDLSDLPEGTYQLTITDDRGCYITTSQFILTNPAEIASTDAVTVCASEYPNGYSYKGNDAWTESGTYIVNFESVNGCDSVVTVTFTMLTNPTMTISSDDDEICQGGTTTLTIDYELNGATSLAWKLNGESQDELTEGSSISIENVAPTANANQFAIADIIASYDGTNVTCSATGSSIEITVNDTPHVTAITVPTDLCPFQGTYNVSATVTNGTTPYTYTWTGATSGETAGQAIVTEAVPGDNVNLCGQPYTVGLTVTDHKGCASNAHTATFTIKDDTDPVIDLPQNFQTTYKATLDESCSYSAPDLTQYIMEYTSDNCTSPEDLTYTQSEGVEVVGQTEDPDKSTYQVTITVTDLCNNSATTTMYYYIPKPIALSDIAVTDQCVNGAIAAEAELSVESGGSAPYTFAIGETEQESGNNNSTTFTGLAAGNYIVTVTDADGCSTESEFSVVTRGSLTITANSNEQEYNGEALTDDGFTYTQNVLADGDELTATVSGSQTNVGTSNNVITEYYIYHGNTDVTCYYDITTVNGTLEVTASDDMTITCYPENSPLTKIYDGQALSYTASSNIVENTTIQYSTDNQTWSSSIPSITHVGTTTVYVKATNSNYEDATCDYTLSVTQRSITLTSATDTKQYDGTALTNNTVTVSGDGWAANEGATYNVTGSQTDVGESNNTFTYILNNNTLAGDYDITTVNGLLTVTQNTTPITITTLDGEKTYDGTPLTVSNYTYTQNVLAAGDVLTVTLNGTQTAAGTSSNTIESYSVMRGNDDVTSFYTFSNPVLGTLTVNRRAVTLTSATESRMYNGSALTNNTVTVTGDGWATNEGATYNVTGSQTNVGSSSNTFTYTLNNNTNADNYTINKTEGTLTVTANDSTIVVTITENSGEYTYDGTEKSVTGYTASIAGSNLYTENDFTYNGSTTVAATHAGTYNMNLSANNFSNTNSNFNNVSFTIVDGTLQINPRVLNIASANLSKTYDGTALTNGETALIITGTDPLNDNAPIGFVEGEGVVPTFTGTQTVVGSSANSFTYTLNEQTTAADYELTETAGTLTVTAFDGTVTAYISGNRGSFTYDGQEHTVSGYNLDSVKCATLDNIATYYTTDCFHYIGNDLEPSVSATTVAESADMGLTADMFENTSTNFSNVTFVISRDGRIDIDSSNTMTVSCPTEVTKVYDGTALNPAATASITEGTTIYYKYDNIDWTQTVPSITEVGTKEVSVKAVNANYNTQFCNYTLTVNKANLTIIINDSKEYDGQAITTDVTANNALGVVTVSGLINNETLTAGAITSNGSNFGIYYYNVENQENSATISTEFATSDGIENYEVTITSTQEITKSNDLVVTCPNVDNSTQTYDGTALEPTATASGMTESDNADILYCTDEDLSANSVWSETAPSITNVGTQHVWVKAESDNYVNDTCEYTLTITQAELTIIINDSKEYDGEPITTDVTANNAQGVVTVSGLINNETLTAGAITSNGSNFGIYYYNVENQENSATISTEFATSDGIANYNVTITSTQEITKSNDLAVTCPSVDNSTKTFDGTALQPTALASGMTESDNATILYCTEAILTDNSVWSETAPSITNVGTQHVWVKAESDNYVNDTCEYTLTVSKANLTIIINDSKEYDGEVLETEYSEASTDGLVNNDALNAGKVTTSGANVGTYTYDSDNAANITTDFNTTLGIDNYEVTYDITQTIVRSDALVVTCPSVDNSTKTFDGTALQPTAATSGMTDSDNATILYCTETNLTANSVWSETAPSITNVGTQHVWVKAESDNYVNDTCEYTLTVSKANLTITINDSKEYDGEVLETEYSEASTDGLVNNDALNAGKVTTSGANVGTYTYNGNNAANITTAFNTTLGIDNYEVTYDITQTINRSDDMVANCPSNNDITKTYDGTALQLTATASGMIEGDNATILYCTDETLTTNSVWSETAPSITNVGTQHVWVKAESNNYVNDTCEYTLTVTPRPVTVRSADGQFTYNGQAHVNHSASVTSETDFLEDVTYRFTGSQTEVGESSNYFTVAWDSVLTEALEANYDVTYVYGTLEVTALGGITVTIIGNSNVDDPFVYNGTTHTVSGYVIDAITLGEEPTTLYTADDFTFNGSASVTQANAGEYGMGLTSSMFTNNNPNFNTVTFVVTDGKLYINPYPVTVNVTGNTVNTTYNGNEQSASGYNVQIIDEGGLGLYSQNYLTVTPSPATITGTDAGTYHNTLAATNNNANFDVTINIVSSDTLKIAPKDVTVNITGNSNTFTYSCEEKEVIGFTATSTNQAYQTYIEQSETEEIHLIDNYTATVERTDAGTSYMGLQAEWFAANNTNYNVTFNILQDGFIHINPKDIEVRINGNQATFTYDGNEHYSKGYTFEETDDECFIAETAISFSGIDSVYATDVLYNNSNEVIAYPMNLNASQFSENDPNFNTTFTIASDGWLKITPATATVTITGAHDTLDYNGSEQQVEGWSASANTDLIVVEEEIEYSGMAIAKRTDLGTTYMGLADSIAAGKFTCTNPNFADVTFQLATNGDGYITIVEPTVHVTIYGHNSTVVYNGEEQRIDGYTFTADNENYTAQDFVFNNPSDTAKGTNAGTYYATVTADQFENTNENWNVEFTVASVDTLTITPAPIVITLNDSKVYDGSELVSTLSGDYMGFTIEGDYYGDLSGEFTSMSADAGTYYYGTAGHADSIAITTAITATDGIENYDVTFIGTQTITKAAVVVAITGEQVTHIYDGTAYTADEYTTEFFINDEITELYSDDDFSLNISELPTASRTDAGTTNMGITSNIFTNNNDNFTATFTVTDGYVTITPITDAISVEITGNSVTANYDAQTHTATGYTFVANPENELLTDNITYSGEATVSRSTVGTSNMNLIINNFGTTSNFTNVTFTLVADGYVTINEALTASATVNDNVSCNGYNDGRATINISGGNAPYTYTFGDIEDAEVTGNSFVLEDLPALADQHVVTIKDALDSTTTATFTITQPEVLTAVSHVRNATCNELGIDTLIVSGGTAPYTCNWNGSETAIAVPVGTTENDYRLLIENLEEGGYTYIVTDAHNCTTNGEASISAPVAITVDWGNSAATTCQGESTAIGVTIEGGTPDYNYEWTMDDEVIDGTTASLDLGNTAAGTHTFTVSVTDASGCTGESEAHTVTIIPSYYVEIEIPVGEGETYTFNDVEYSAGQTFTQELQSINGCDSTVVTSVVFYGLTIEVVDSVVTHKSTARSNFYMDEFDRMTDAIPTIQAEAETPGNFYAYVHNGDNLSDYNADSVDIRYELYYNNVLISDDEFEDYVSSFRIGSYYDKFNTFFSQPLESSIGEIPENTFAYRTTANANITPFDYFNFKAFVEIPNKIEYNFIQAGTYTLKLKLEKRIDNGEYAVNNKAIYNPYYVNRRIGPLYGGKNSDPLERATIATRTINIVVGGPQTAPSPAPTGIEENAGAIARVEAYPNPTNNELHVRMEGIHGQTVLQLVDAQGKVVRTHSTELEGTEGTWTFSVRDLSEGVYFLNVRNDSTVMTEKIVVTRR